LRFVCRDLGNHTFNIRLE
jgi:hypothetical protein